MNALRSIVERLRGPTPEPLEGEPTIAPLGASGSSAVARGLLFVMVLGGVGVAGATMVLRGDGADERENSRERVAPARGAPPKAFERPEPKPEPAPEPAPEPEPEAGSAAEEPEPVVETVYVPTYRQPPEPAPATIHKGAMPMTVADASTSMSQDTMVVSDAGGMSGEYIVEDGWSEPASGGSARDALGNRLAPTAIDGASASVIPNAPLVLPRGTMIDCALRMQLVSELPGPTACKVTRDVYSPSGVLLVERGSEITGEYDSAVAQGGRRVFVLWTRIRTPRNVVIALDSPGTGPRGAVGLTGRVNSRFWQRFGAAILVSLVDDVANAAVLATADDIDAEIQIGAGSAGAGVIESVLAQTLDIRPTVGVDAGSAVAIHVARDLSFASVYEPPVR